MVATAFIKKLFIFCLAVAGFVLMGTAHAQQNGGYQQPPGMPQSPYSTYNPPANNQQPQQQQQQQQTPAVQPGTQLTDAFAQFRVALPQGAQPLTSTYILNVPSTGMDVVISATLNPQVFQSHVQNLPGSLQQQGARITQDRKLNIQNLQCRYILAELNSNNQSYDVHVLLIPGPDMLLRINCPSQMRQLAQQTMDMMLDNLQIGKRQQ